ncbi:MAG: protease modulator HflC, partial [Endozoicomonadaceae bacterium]|nr:protease modulator HflC [Endozoicomonadaceae bacterium]
MKNAFVIFIIGCFILLIGFFDALFILTEKERGVVLRFGQLVDANITPGLHVKLPFIDKLYRFDARLQSLSLPSSRFLTKEKKAVIVDAYVKWKIVNVPVFYRSTSGDLFRANTLLSQRIESSLRDKFGSLTLIDVVSGQRDELMEEITHGIALKTQEALGIKVQDVRVKKIDLPQSVSESVFNRMNSEREKEAREYRAQGKESA